MFSHFLRLMILAMCFQVPSRNRISGNVQQSTGFVQSVFYGLGAAGGFALVLIMFAAIRERLDAADIPAPFRGSAIALITAGMMSLAFMGFAGMARP